MIHLGALYYWLSAYPVRFIDSSSIFLQFGIIGSYWLEASIVMGISTGLFAMIIKNGLLSRMFLIVFGPMLWVVSEMCASLLFSIASMGPGGTINIQFSFGYLGYLVAQSHSLASVTGIAGVYGLSFLASLIAILLYVYMRDKLYKHTLYNILALFCFLLLFIFVPYFKSSYEHSGTHVVVVETNFDKEFWLKEFPEEIKSEEIVDAVANALEYKSDVIILPEDSRLTDAFDSTDKLFQWVTANNSEYVGVIVDSGKFFTDEDAQTSVLRVYMYDVKEQSVSFFDKQYLVPQGEFLPYFHGAIMSLFMSQDRLNGIKENLQYIPGSVSDSTMIPSNLPAVLFCSESISPSGVRSALQARNPSFVTHLVSHAWFSNPYSLWYQLDSMLRIQSMWNDIPIVSAGNVSQSKLYLPTGHIETGILLVETPLWSIKSFSF